LLRDGVLNNLSLLLSGLIGIVLVPIMLKGLGAESYGVWIAAFSVMGTAGLIDFGLALGVTREAATALGSDSWNEAAPFIRAAGTVFFLTGIAGGILIATVGLPLSRGLRLSAATRPIAPMVFALTGICFLGDRLLTFTTAVLRGLRRFDLTNLLAVAMAVFRAAGIIALLKTGRGVVGVMVWQVAATAAAAWAGQAMIGWLEPRFGFRLGWFRWSQVRSNLAFSLASQLTTIVEVMIWDVAPLVVGLVLGSVWIVPYYIAQRFPTSVGPVIWSIAEALFPAASQHQHDREIDRTREILEVGTRWIVVVALPLCMGLWIVAPHLLQAWVGNVAPGSARILRLITLAVYPGRVHGGSLGGVHPGAVGARGHANPGDDTVLPDGGKPGPDAGAAAAPGNCRGGVGPGGSHVHRLGGVHLYWRPHVRNAGAPPREPGR
jgi:O-antigen/teichoic acid export membrane protein